MTAEGSSITGVFDATPAQRMGAAVKIRGSVSEAWGAIVTVESGACTLSLYPTPEACDELAAHFSELAYRTRRVGLKAAA